MTDQTRRIGLSLGADICWPICFEELLRRLDLSIQHGGETLRFDVDRVTIEPFDLKQDCRYDVVIDRLTHWYHTSREWIKKAIILNDLYVFNNPWTLQSMEKQTTYCAMMRLGLPVPDTWMVPPKSYQESSDLEPTLRQYARLFNIKDIGDKLGYPLFMKPYDGGAWVGVTKIDDGDVLSKTYDDSGTRVMNLQKGVFPHDRFVRCVGLGPQVRFVSYDPAAPLHDRYKMERNFLSADEESLLRDTTLTINAFFGWDFNSCEVLSQNGTWYPIDFANACPDSQVTSLHYHFPWLLKANLRWAIYCAATRKKLRTNLDWDRYYAIAEEDMSYRERIAAYAAIARERFETDRFEEFCAQHLGHLDEIADEFFGSDIARDAIHQKVSALYPAHEIEPFTDLFFKRIQHWRETERA